MEIKRCEKDYIEGETLEQKLMKTGIMTYTECFQLLCPMMESLEKMHRQGFIYRYISPGRIMVQPDGSACLLDFNAAENSFILLDDDPHQEMHITGFQPPEMFMKDQDTGIGPWTDVYSLCATIYYCITGKTFDTLDRLLEDTLTFDLPMSEPLSEAVISVLRDGLKLSRKERIQTVGKLLERLQGAKAETLPGFLVKPNDPISQMMYGNHLTQIKDKR